MSKSRLIPLSVLAVLVATATVAALASATEFYRPPSDELITETLAILAQQTNNQVLKGTLAGVKVTVTCTEAHATGSINNTAGMGLGLILALISNCTVSGAGTGGCQVANGKTIHINMHVLAVGTAPAPELEFAPNSGETFVNITFESCSEEPALNTSFPVSGTVNAIVHNAAEEIEFTAASTANLVFGGNKASLTGKSKIEMEGGGAIKVE